MKALLTKEGLLDKDGKNLGADTAKVDADDAADFKLLELEV